jgi:hypothetical protein
VTNAAPAPTVSLSATPASITAGQSATLSWTSTNATSCTGSGFTADTTSGSTSVSPTQTATYSITCSGAGGTSDPASATVTVTNTTPNQSGVGSRVKTSVNLNVREQPLLTGTLLCIQPAGSLGTLAAPAGIAQNHNWWKVTWDIGCNGFSVGDYLKVQ